MYNRHKINYSSAFTIVELLVVIVIIGILAAITIVSYTGISQRATVSSIQSDLTNAANQLKVYQVANMTYPTTLDCSSTPPANSICLKASPNNTFIYSPNNTVNPPTFSLTETNTNGTVYNITDSSRPIAGIGCPTGFIPVPGSSTYGTGDFCVMKYAASQVGSSNIPASASSAQPWVNISQATAIADASNVVGCTGCHLITEAEWMTIAQNVLGVSSNWSGGAVGNGYIYSGHSDNDPWYILPADSNDANGYAGTNNTSPSNQRRTLTLTNGQVIWDFAGNVQEWTNTIIASSQQPGLSGESVFTSKEWNNGSLLMNGLPYNSQPASTGISGITSWSSAQGIGQLYSNHGTTNSGYFLRGGYYGGGSGDGILSLDLSEPYGNPYSNRGFRASR
jgi:prepilin-type N-terminal cleavage/methylation domain-containing protein